MAQEQWPGVDRYITDLLVGPDPALDQALAAGLFQDRCFRPDTPGRWSGGMGTVSDDI
jgi:hypothetical protein